MRLLLDTRAFLWWVFDDARLSPVARDLIGDPAAEILFGAVSGWKIAIKALTGRLGPARGRAGLRPGAGAP